MARRRMGKKQVTVNLPEHLVRRLKDMSDLRQITMTEIIRDALQKQLSDLSILREASDLIARVDGVVKVRLGSPEKGEGLGSVQLVTEASRNAEDVVNDVRAVIRKELGIEIDKRKISVTPFSEDSEVIPGARHIRLKEVASNWDQFSKQFGDLEGFETALRCGASAIGLLRNMMSQGKNLRPMAPDLNDDERTGDVGDQSTPK